MDGQWRLLPNEVVYKETESIVDTMRKRRIAFFCHISRLPDTRQLKVLFNYFFKSKTKNSWFMEIQNDLDELGLTMSQIANKDEKNILKNKNIRLPLKTFTRKTYTISDAERAARSTRMKMFWEKKKNKKLNL